ncbi:MAG: hypothetical protein SF028_14250 [Candidatus Sumerlaeia bacterium]|nr:hypothetical protein [Candidatus Sumerlaeia bacterium]
MADLPTKVLALRMLTGESPLGYEPVVHLRRASDWSHLPDAARNGGIRSVLAVNNLELMRSIRRGLWRGFEVVPVVPNVTGYIRDTVDYGLVGAGIRRLLQLGPVSLARVGFASLAVAPGVLRREFPALLRVLLEVEACAFGKLQPERLVLAPQITDLAVAFDNPRVVQLFLEFCRARGERAFLCSNNPAMLVRRLERWGFRPQGYILPVNRSGYLCGDLEWMKSSSMRNVTIAADVIGGGAMANEDAVRFAGEAGAEEVVVDADAIGY